MRIDYRESVLSNGLRVVTVPAPGVDGVSMGLWVPAGGRYEIARNAGISHFIEHLIFKGTRRRSARAISHAVEGRGGTLDAYTQEEITFFAARVTARHAEAVMEIVGDMVQRPRFDESDIAREREVICEEISLYRDQPQHLVEDLLMEALWPGHPLGLPITGTEESLARVGAREIRRYKGRHYRAGGSLLGVGGAVEHDKVLRWARAALGSMPAGRPPRWLPAGRRWEQSPIEAAEREIDQVHVALGFRGPGRHDPRKYALRMLSIMLGGYMSSRLFQTVRERHGLAYSISSGLQLFDDGGFFSVEAGIDAGRAARAMALIGRELARMRKSGPSKTELARAREYALGQMLLGLESPASRLAWVGEQSFIYRRVAQPDEIVRRIEAIGSEDVRRAAEILSPARLSVALVHPPGTDPVSLRRALLDGLG